MSYHSRHSNTHHVNSVVEEGAHGKYSVKSEECGGVDPQDNTQEPHEEKRNERGLYQVTSRARHLVYHEAALRRESVIKEEGATSKQ